MGDRKSYQKILISQISIIFIILIMASTCFAATGVLLLVKGKVTVNSLGLTYPASTGLRLKPGDIVGSLGGTASILLSDGRIDMVDKESSFTVPKEKIEDSEDEMIIRLMDTIRATAHRGKELTIEESVEEEEEKGAEEKEKKEIRLIYPYNSFITLNKLRFEWEGMKGVEDIYIFLKSPSPVYKYSFKAQSGKNRALLPKDARPLLPGIRYYWKVRGFEIKESESYASRLCWFTILGPEKADALNAEIKKINEMGDLDKNNKEFLKANLLISYGLYHNAANILKKSRQQFPEDVGMKELLIGLFLKMKKFEEAEKLN